jgi:hypothetical protein
MSKSEVKKDFIPKFITPALCARLKIKDFQDTNVHLKMNIGIRQVLKKLLNQNISRVLPFIPNSI